MVRTPGFHPGNRSSILREVTTLRPDPRDRVFAWCAPFGAELNSD